MEMIYDYIPTNTNAPTLSEFAKAIQTKVAMSSKPQVKLASKVEKEEVVKKVDNNKVKAATQKKAEAEEAESSGQLDVEVELVNDPHADPKLKGTSKGKKTKCEEGESSGQLDPKANPNNKPEVKSSVKTAWVALANLSKEQKTKMRTELEKFWPKKFVDSVLADR